MFLKSGCRPAEWPAFDMRWIASCNLLDLDYDELECLVLVQRQPTVEPEVDAGQRKPYDASWFRGQGRRR